jgi:electron transfer flavoprotein alpha subunit
MNRNADQLTLHEAMAVVLRGRGWVERDAVASELAERELGAYLGGTKKSMSSWLTRSASS